MPERHTQVLVAGGSLVGLSTSVLLASYGVPHLVVESHQGTAIHPRAASFHQRTMEVFRSAGLQREVEEAAAREFRQGAFAARGVAGPAARHLRCRAAANLGTHRGAGVHALRAEGGPIAAQG